jgi:hypothetical protein
MLIKPLVNPRDYWQKRTGVFIFSKEGVTQRDPISMFAYGVGIPPHPQFPDSVTEIHSESSEK